MSAPPQNQAALGDSQPPAGTDPKSEGTGEPPHAPTAAAHGPRCSRVCRWVAVLNDTFHTTEPDFAQCTSIRRYCYNLDLTAKPPTARLTLDYMEPADDSFLTEDGNWYEVNVWFQGLHYLDINAAPVIIQVSRNG